MSSVDSLFEEPYISLDSTSSRKRKHEEDHEDCSIPNLIPLDVNKEPIFIGRLKNVTVRLQCSEIPSMISRKHASIVYSRLKRKWNIKDLESCNGVYLNKKKIEPDKWTEIKVNDQICFGTPISKNSFRYTLEHLPDEDYQLVRVGQQTPSSVKKKCEDGVSSIAEIVVNISTDTAPISTSSTTNDNELTGETKAVADTGKTEPVASTPDVSSDSVTAEGSSNRMMFSMQEEFLCVICQELFINAHVLSCSHSFCETCITDWLKKNNICPICRKKVKGKPVRSLVLDNAINRLVECMPEKDRNERASVLKDRAPQPEVILIADSPIRRRPNAVVRINVLDSSSDSDSELEESSPPDSDLDDYNGLPGYEWGGYGNCYRCGDPYHWAPGCPN